MKEHPVIGERILRAIPGLGGVARIVRHEHERWDGGGYPDGISGDTIPIGSRIILACDAYHAMTSDRPYRKAMSHGDALRELRKNAGHAVRPAGRRGASGLPLRRPGSSSASDASPDGRVARSRRQAPVLLDVCPMVNPLGRLHPGRMPDLNEALAWTGFRVDDVYGARVGTVAGHLRRPRDRHALLDPREDGPLLRRPRPAARARRRRRHRPRLGAVREGPDPARAADRARHAALPGARGAPSAPTTA